MSASLDALILATGWAHVLLAPYTKVEESFNLHATHDVLMYGVGQVTLYNYDHFTFPGAVPRTFIGSVLLAWISTPAIQFANWLGLAITKFDLQIILRMVLATLNAIGLCLLRRAVDRRFGRPTGLFFTLLTCSQFHIPFWMGRTLPNMFALLPVNISTYLILDRAPNAIRPSSRSINSAIALLIFTAVVFRAEVLLLLIPLVLQSLILRYTTFFTVLKIGLISGLISVALTVTVDSYFWDQYALWPEFAGFYFNVYAGKSAEWGTSPPLAYVTTHLPKLLLTSLPLSICGFILDKRIRSLVLPSIFFVVVISCLGHKEWRFVVYVVPVVNIAAARGARWLVSRRKNSITGRFLFLIVSVLILANISITSLLTISSVANYPGGQALALFNHKYSQATPRVHVHISNLAAQTGASLFLHTHARPYPSVSLLPYHSPPPPSGEWKYNKTESLSMQSLTSSKSITHLISESKPPRKMEKIWTVVEGGAVEGFDKWVVNWNLWDTIKKRDTGELLAGVHDVLKMTKEVKLWILERKDRS